MPNKVVKTLYDKKIKKLLIEVHKNGKTIEEIQNIGNHLSHKFSNSMCSLISNLQLR